MRFIACISIDRVHCACGIGTYGGVVLLVRAGKIVADDPSAMAIIIRKRNKICVFVFFFRSSSWVDFPQPSKPSITINILKIPSERRMFLVLGAKEQSTLPNDDSSIYFTIFLLLRQVKKEFSDRNFVYCHRETLR